MNSNMVEVIITIYYMILKKNHW